MWRSSRQMEVVNFTTGRGSFSFCWVGTPAWMRGDNTRPAPDCPERCASARPAAHPLPPTRVPPPHFPPACSPSARCRTGSSRTTWAGWSRATASWPTASTCRWGRAGGGCGCGRLVRCWFAWWLGALALAALWVGQPRRRRRHPADGWLRGRPGGEGLRGQWRQRPAGWTAGAPFAASLRHTRRYFPPHRRTGA